MEGCIKASTRLGIAEFIIALHSTGPLAHWNEMYNESFLVTQGMVTFHAPGKEDGDAQLGDSVATGMRVS